MRLKPVALLWVVISIGVLAFTAFVIWSNFAKFVVLSKQGECHS